MVEMKTLIRDLANSSEKLKRGETTVEELEKVTTSIMLHEDYEGMDEEFQDIIELLDTAEIQNLSERQIDEILERLNAYSK